jgi:hypothetical protein
MTQEQLAQKLAAAIREVGEVDPETTTVALGGDDIDALAARLAAHVIPTKKAKG